MKRSAELSDCMKFRWWLRRAWDAGNGKAICFVMLNPSTADAEKDDPTIKKCIGFAQAWGFSGLIVRNLYAYRATKPADLFKAMLQIDVSGAERGYKEFADTLQADAVIVAWGAHATQTAVDRFMKATDPKPLYCLDKNKDGSPVHPLYQPANKIPIPFARCDQLTWQQQMQALLAPA